MKSTIIYPAHILVRDDKSSIVQTVEEHSRNTAQIAADHLKKIKLDKAAVQKRSDPISDIMGICAKPSMMPL